MADFEKHLYLILYPNEALVASQLSPQAFGRHYSVGSPRHFTGKVIFAEVDGAYRHEYLRIDEYLAQTVSATPGAPKRTKFVKSYRVLEHVDLAALRQLFLVTTDGAVLTLDRGEEPADARAPRVRVYQEICPLRLLVASNLTPNQFGHYITAESWSKGAPKIFFTEYDVDIEAAVREGISGITGPIANVNPASLGNALQEMRRDPGKKTKTLSLNPNLDRTSYKSIQPGFWFSDGMSEVFYRMPTMDELHRDHYTWWKHL